MAVQISVSGAVLLGSEADDFGLVQAADAYDQAQQLANEEGVAIVLRCPLTDTVLDTVEPGNLFSIALDAVLPRDFGI